MTLRLRSGQALRLRSPQALRLRAITLAALLSFAAPAPAVAYSVLAHETMIDAAWDDTIVPLLKQRFPRATDADVTRSRAFAYGGSVMPDLGYYPFGSHLFTNLVHYVRSGDFVEALLRNASTIDELAFAVGAMAHYAADNAGHPLAVNKSVPLIYPKTRAKFGDDVTYVEDPKRHVIVEFAFDVVQVAAGAYLPDAYRAFIGFEVSKPLLERAFRETYALDIDDLFVSTDLAIGTFRWAVSRTIPEMTVVAWRDKADEIRKVTPTVQRAAFIYRLTRQEYEKTFGTNYRKPGFLARSIGVIMKVVPKFGPFRPLAFKVPTPEAERLFAESFRTASDRYRRQLADARDGRIELANTDFDTGRPAAWGEYPLADETYIDLVGRLAKRRFTDAAPELRRDIVLFFQNRQTLNAGNGRPRTPKGFEEQLVELRRLDRSIP
jgi:hypothetical protein